MNKNKKTFLLVALIVCVFVFVIVVVSRGRENKVENTVKTHESIEKATIISGLEKKLSEARTSDNSLSDMSQNEISSAVELLHEKGMKYEEITVQDLRHANDVIPEKKIYTDEELNGLTDLELAKTGAMSIIEGKPESPLVFWVLPDRTENGYNISTGSETPYEKYLYDWNYAKTNYAHDFDYLSRDEEQLKMSVGMAYSELLTDFNTYTSYHGLDADEYLSPGEEGRFVLLRWFKFKNCDKKGWAVCYVNVINTFDEKRTKRDCPMTQILFEV